MSALLSDTALIFGRYARQTTASVFQVLFGILMPMLYLLLFGPLLTGLPLGAEGDSWQVLVPGLLLQLSLFGALFTGFGIVIEKQTGVVERMLVTPVSRLALLLGRVLRDALLLVFQAVLLVGTALAMGLRAPVGGVLIGFAFVAVTTVALASLSYSLAMRVSKPQEFAPVVNTATMPAMPLSGLMLPMSLAPGWLDGLSHVMPLRYLVDAVRAGYVGDCTGPTTLYGALVALAFAALAMTVGVRAFRRSGA
ncbi:ABC transporter permease [Streptomyces tsukubensis]|uniref:Transport permease protein n=1 Tax=Streptomyces tsukubensis TaxID=83656 RepID=A0A1V4A0Y3_9ACTN|nr:ABC transporter permease [Streptomyces tsukubensis]OON72017.1 multidrug ABC transporter permease [Streptomyces tsukubensis]QFR98017.1 ABC transporter permease [Streptomyces tsukubensis]